MKTIWSWSYEQEAKRIAYACTNISNGFYAQQGYTVLPSGTSTHHPTTTIYLPDLNYGSIPRFWETVSKVDFKQTQPLKDSVITPIIPAIVSRLKLSEITPEPSHPIKPVWEKYSTKILNELCGITGINLKDISSITIHPTRYGSNGSFDVASSLPAEIKLELRLDQGLKSLLSIIILALQTKPLTEQYQATWKQIKFLSEWLINSSPLSRLIDKYELTTTSTSLKSLGGLSQNKKLYEQSLTFLKRIGAPISTSDLTQIDNQISYNNKPLLHLTEREKAILASLISSRPNVLTLEEMGDLIFESENLYSLTTITKTIQHLRDKLEKNSIPSSMIKTIYGQGYALR